MDGVDDIRRVNDMISELKKHHLHLTSDDAYEKAQSMLLGKPLTPESDITPAEREVDQLTRRLNALAREVITIQEQMKGFSDQLQYRKNSESSETRATLPQPSSAPPTPHVQPTPPPAQPEQQQLAPVPAAPQKPAFDPSVENIFYCGNR